MATINGINTAVFKVLNNDVNLTAVSSVYKGAKRPSNAINPSVTVDAKRLAPGGGEGIWMCDIIISIFIDTLANRMIDQEAHVTLANRIQSLLQDTELTLNSGHAHPLIGGGITDLMITLTPQNPPIQIPAGGGSFTFDILIENITANVINFDGWTHAVLPNSVVYPLFQRTGLSLPGGGTLNRTMTQNVPGGAPPGNYTLAGFVGTYPGTIIDEDSFPFEKMAGDATPNHNLGWSLFGWDDDTPELSTPAEFTMLSAYPNPFNPSTVISFELRDASYVDLAVYDISGREVAQLAEGFMSAGVHEAVFDGSTLSSGVYFVNMTAGDFNRTQKLLLIK